MLRTAFAALALVASSIAALALDAASIPTKFPIPWSDTTTAPYIQTIPEASQIGITNGRASLQTGFPPLTFTPTAAGGTPPFGADFNGIFKQITQWSRWQAAGAPVFYDGGFATSISGYPKAAILAGTTFGDLWLNQVDNNTTDPNAGGANWLRFPLANYYVADSGTLNAIVATFTPAPASAAAMVGRLIAVKIGNTSTSTTVTLTVNGFSPWTVVLPDGRAPPVGQLKFGMVAVFVYDGTNAQLVSVPAATGPTSTSITTEGAGTYTTPASARWIKVRMVGAGGGSGGNGTGGAATAGSAGTATVFGSVTASGGNGGAAAATSAGGIGGTANASGAGTATVRVLGIDGQNGQPGVNLSNFTTTVPAGGSTPFGGGTTAPAANTGAGAPGTASGSLNYGASGAGASGEYAEIIIISPAATYSYTVGTKGTFGAAGSGGGVGKVGSAGRIIVEEHY